MTYLPGAINDQRQPAGHRPEGTSRSGEDGLGLIRNSAGGALCVHGAPLWAHTHWHTRGLTHRYMRFLLSPSFRLCWRECAESDTACSCKPPTGLRDKILRPNLPRARGALGTAHAQGPTVPSSFPIPLCQFHHGTQRWC